MQLEVQCQQEIAAVPGRVWHYVADDYFAHHATWDPAVVDMIKTTPGPVGVGTEGVEVRRMGRRQSARFHVTEFDSPRRFAFRNTSGPFELDRSYTFAPNASGTRLTFRFTMRPRGAMWLLFPLLRPLIRRQVHDNIARLPRVIASTTVDSPSSNSVETE